MAFKSKNKKSAVVSVTSSRVVKPPPVASQSTAASEPDLKKTSSYIAQELQETAKTVRFQILRIIKKIGAEAALGYLKRAQEVEKSGGMLTLDRTKRRTPGGVFFRLVKIDHPDFFQVDWKAIRTKKAAKKKASQQKKDTPMHDG